MRLRSQPEAWDHFLWEATLKLVQKLHLFSSSSFLSFLHLFHSVEVEKTSRMVKVNPQCGAERHLRDLHGLALVPGIVTWAAPAETPGLLVLPEAAGPIAVPPCRVFVRHSEHHPSGKLHLPVPSEAQNSFFAQNLWEGK